MLGTLDYMNAASFKYFNNTLSKSFKTIFEFYYEYGSKLTIYS